MIPNPWVLLGVVLAWLASLATVGIWQRHDGQMALKAAYEARDNETLTAANKRIHDLEEAARATEQEHAAQIAAIGEAHEKDLQAFQAQRERDVASALSGDLRLRVPGGCQAGGSKTPEASPAPAERDVAQGSELPRKVTADLLALADEADDVARQLQACQAVILSDRKESP